MSVTIWRTMMMNHMAQPHVYKRMNDLRRRDAERYAENWRLMRLAKPLRKWTLPKPGCWLMCQLGHALVWLGERLQGYASPQPAALRNGQ
jgi:hypothetical protein